MPHVTTRQYVLNVAWFALATLLLLAMIFAAAKGSSTSLTWFTSGVAFAFLFGMLAGNLTKIRTVEPPRLQEKTFLPFLMATVCVIAGYWNQGLSLVNLVWPLSLYFVFVCNDRLLDWAKEK